jgi:hypothetical protein
MDQGLWAVSGFGTGDPKGRNVPDSETGSRNAVLTNRETKKLIELAEGKDHEREPG